MRALREASNGIYGLRSFTDYLREVGADPSHHRPAALSVDTRSQLPDRLAEEDAMVLQLGQAADTPGPRFALVRVPGRLDDFFVDERAFPADDRETVDYTLDGEDTAALGRAARDALDVHRSLPTHSERGFVHLALSMGLLSRALGLDAPTGLAPPTVASSFEFAFEPHSDRPTTLRYDSGHLELDALVSARRDGKRVLPAVTANCGGRVAVAKHAVGARRSRPRRCRPMSTASSRCLSARDRRQAASGTASTSGRYSPPKARGSRVSRDW